MKGATMRNPHPSVNKSNVRSKAVWGSRAAAQSRRAPRARAGVSRSR